jgi:hypothetical protein
MRSELEKSTASRKFDDDDDDKEDAMMVKDNDITCLAR